MGNGNPAGNKFSAAGIRLPTPHGEREPVATRSARRRSAPTSNPSWGTGTRFPQIFRDLGIGLPTPHGERELPPDVGPAVVPPIFQPLMGNGNWLATGSVQRHHPSSNPSWGTGTNS